MIHYDFGHPNPKLNKRQLARHWGRSQRWIEQQVRAGMPSQLERVDKRLIRIFELYACEAWLGSLGDAPNQVDPSVNPETDPAAEKEDQASTADRPPICA